ncbi:hypothetical protein Golax_022976 [Gossypium laxum]|uniref:Cytochrome P450 n=1 Tax=Gossypium laxum TaxID=34288 RepID=A0A7J9B2Z5_9ROSI|nr:hypothetical protein [Gossypium laxum]
MVDVLLQLAEDPNLDVKLERYGVKDNLLLVSHLATKYFFFHFMELINLIAGGTKSSTVTVEWAILEMLKKLEIDKERWVEEGVAKEKGIVNLPYIDSIAKETMRLHLVAPMLVPHQACEHCQVVGYDILKCTRALVNVWTNRRDLKVWENPNEFWPERFIGKTIDVKGHDF